MKTVLFWMMGGMTILTDIEASLAYALKARGVNVHAILCDGSYTACIQREAHENIPVSEWRNRCPGCVAGNIAVLNKFSIDYSLLSDYVNRSIRLKFIEMSKDITWDTINDLTYNGSDLSKHIKSAIVRFLRAKKLYGYEEVVPEYAFSAFMAAEASVNAINVFSPDRVFMSQGIYAAWGPALMNSLKNHISVVSYMSCHLPTSFYFKTFKVDDLINGISHLRLSNNSWEKIKNQELSVEQKNKLNKFMECRYKKYMSSDIRNFQIYIEKGKEHIKTHYSIESSKPVWGILCHVNFDAVFDHIHMICNDYNDWTLQTLKTIIDIPEIEWLVKIHPAEAIWNPESGVLKFIQDNFNTLPKHVKIVLPDNSISPLNFFEFLDGVVTVGGTAGLEMATMGKPVIISGSTHYGMKGFTYDAANINEYVSFLKGTDTLKELDKNQIEIAQKYAYCYFLLRQIPLPLFRMTDSQYCFIQRNDIDILLPHMNDFYDFLCNEIVHGDDFIMPENLVTLLDDRF